MRKTLLLSLIFFALLGTSCQKGENKEEKQSSKSKGGVIPVEAIILKPQELKSSISAVGTLKPNEEIELTSEISGKIVSIYFQEGSFVKKGDLLLKINDDDLQAQLQKNDAQLRVAKDIFSRQESLLESDAVSQEQFERAKADYESLLADKSLLKVKIEKTEIRAPFSGTIGVRNVSVGAYLTPNHIIAQLVDDSSMKIDFSIPERYADKGLVGKKVLFTTQVSSTPKEALVYAMQPQIDEQTKTVLLRAKCANDGDLTAGMFARINLITAILNNALLIPTEAVVPEMEGKSVWVLSNGIAKLVPVESDQRTERMIHILSGVSQGDTIITTGLMQLRPDSKVNVTLIEQE